MFIINTKSSLERLQAVEWLPPSVKASVKELFNHLWEAHHEEGYQSGEMSCADPEATLVVLEPSDRLSVVFTDAPSGIEYAELFVVVPVKAYRIGVHDNDQMKQYIVLPETLNTEDKVLLEQMVTEGGCRE